MVCWSGLLPSEIHYVGFELLELRLPFSSLAQRLSDIGLIFNAIKLKPFSAETHAVLILFPLTFPFRNGDLAQRGT